MKSVPKSLRVIRFFVVFVVLFVVIGVTMAMSKENLVFEATVLDVLEPSKTYQEILATGTQPGLPPEHDFPTSYQYLNGCYGYSVGHILMDRGWDFDMLEMEQRVEKPREELWSKEYKKRLEAAYDLDLKFSKDAELLFQLLEAGEAVVVGYEYPLVEGDWVLHAVAAYSFDEEGIWVSDSLEGGNIRIPYNKIFTEDGQKTRYYFTRVLEN